MIASLSTAAITISTAFVAAETVSGTQHVVVLGGVVFLRLLVMYVGNWAFGTAAVSMGFDLRQRLFARFLAAGVPFHDANRSAELVGALNAELSLFRDIAATSLTALLTSGPVLIAVAVLIVWANPVLAGAIAVVALPGMALVGWSQYAMRRSQRQSFHANSLSNAVAQETLLGIRAVQALRIESNARARYAVYLRSALTSLQSVMKWQATREAVVPFTAIVAAVIAAAIIQAQTAAGLITTASITFIGVAGAAGLASALSVLRAMAGFEQTSSAIHRISTYWAGAVPLPEGDTTVAVGDLVFDHVTLRYADGRVALDDLSMHIGRGERVAIVGDNGAGKSTIAWLCLRLRDPTAGTISMGGTDAREARLDDWRRNFALLTRDPVMFGLSVAENIALGKPGATRTEIENAAAHAGFASIVPRLPHGYDTIIGEQGLNLSSGQRQRLALARIFLQDPSVVILDEALVSIDAESTTAILDAIHGWLGDRSLLVVSPELPAGVTVDRVIQISKGRIVSEDLVAIPSVS